MIHKEETPGPGSYELMGIAEISKQKSMANYSMYEA